MIVKYLIVLDLSKLFTKVIILNMIIIEIKSNYNYKKSCYCCY